MSTLSKAYLTPEQYLEIDRKAERKSEYFAGEMYVMSGARRAHNVIAANAIRELGNQLLDGPCEIYPSEMRVKVGESGLHTYPDIAIVCGEPKLVDDAFDTLLNPIVLVEILSESTEVYGRTTKFELYGALDSLQEYVLISSLRPSLERYTRRPDGTWNYAAKTAPEDSIELKSVNCRLRVADVYRKVEFAKMPPRMREL